MCIAVFYVDDATGQLVVVCISAMHESTFEYIEATLEYLSSTASRWRSTATSHAVFRVNKAGAARRRRHAVRAGAS